jgi:Ca2+-binding RTX toxin-like protein
MPAPTPPITEFIWFGARAVRLDPLSGEQLELLDGNEDFATRTLTTGTFDNTGSEWLQLLAFNATQAEIDAFNAANATDIDLSDGVDTALTGQVNTTGDLRVGEGVEAHNIADIAGNGRLVDVAGTLDESNDPLTITGLGRANLSSLDSAGFGAADTGNRVVFTNDNGFGLINAMGAENPNNAHRLNDGDSINFSLNGGRTLGEASFTVKVLGGGSTSVLVDSDGAMLRDTTPGGAGGIVQDASAGELNLGVLTHGTRVAIDFIEQTILIDNVAFDGDAAAFFAEWIANGRNDLTLGSLLGNATGWSADDLVLAMPETAEQPDEIVATDDPNDTQTPPDIVYVEGDDGDNAVVLNDAANAYAGLGGNDTIESLNGNDTLLGGEGNDRLVGGGNADQLFGEAGADTLLGGTNPDLLSGGSGDDSAVGSSGGDTIYGGEGEDTLSGDSGADRLFGGSSADSLEGGTEADTLVGGYGADTLLGGDGSDDFVYLAGSDSGDRIIGFEVGLDDIVLTGLGVTAYDATFGSAFAAANTASSYVSGGDRIVIVDLDGNTANAELVITLAGNPALSASDFVF